MLVRLNVDAARLSNYRGGGTVEKLYLPSNAEEMADALKNLKGGDPFILGGGSNTLFKDGAINRPIVSTANLDNICIEDGCVFASAGTKLNDIVAFGRQYGLGGLEFLAGVPCTLGGAIRMNAGAFNNEMSVYISEITILSDDFANIDIVDARDVEWCYRQGPKIIILGAKLKLEEISREESIERAREFTRLRAKKQPRLPSLGSVFKNADKPAGYYIEQAGLKGKVCGGAQISTLHANIIVNIGGGTASDYLSLVCLAEETVQERFDVKLEREFVTV